ncbi:hypothetical protein LPJ78_005836 [Coemansia sp. RSA 989]|nr:hypothetical protein LPJ68_005730 [Coemansia sp. RSA 1086]KAJ1746482.1 hypothetical protein LPJ79_005850 [Coemansia sp. RSA 1821]KAJ1860439.1 hypothetical protein LPJ78_005836 [Coemansia sp. RSA 989]KAJ1868663.1 hypothetical protein LPJ55_005843 [Coemansia sp. RSA 990]KAJ2669024.1 hypothetical protein IWW42_004866 [Coemansia sp. RSA 1085]
MPQMLVLVGLPGCGKTAFARRMAAHIPGWERINQDEMGSRSLCEQHAAKSLKEGKNVVIDRCNFDEDQRKIWVKIAEDAFAPVDALFFDVDVKVCKERVKARSSHPTGVEGKFGAEVVARFDRLLTRPTIYEGFRYIHNIAAHLPAPKKGMCEEEVFCHGTIDSIMLMFPPSKKAEPCKGGEAKPCEEAKVAVKVEEPKCEVKEEVKVEVKVEEETKKKAVDFCAAEFAGEPPVGTIVKPNEGYGTYKETKAMWEDENHTQHFNHSLYNEQADRELAAGREADRRTRHIQHSDHMVNPSAGLARAFDHLSLDRDQEGHEVDCHGKRRHFHDRSHYYHQHEHQENAKAGTARTYEHKHMNSFRHVHADKPDKARTEAFEHRSFNYAYKGGAGFDPEQVMMSSSKNKLKFEDEIKASFHNLPVNDHFSFAQNVKWESEFPTRPNWSVFGGK